jgi:hypothetical protein
VFLPSPLRPFSSRAILNENLVTLLVSGDQDSRSVAVHCGRSANRSAKKLGARILRAEDQFDIMQVVHDASTGSLGFILKVLGLAVVMGPALSGVVTPRFAASQETRGSRELSGAIKSL